MIPLRLLRLAAQVWPLIGLAVLVTMVTSLLALATALAVAATLAALAVGAFGVAGGWLAVVAALLALRLVAAPAAALCRARLGRAVRLRLRARLLEKVGELGAAWATRARLGAAQATLLDGVDGLDAYYTTYLPQLCVTALLSIGIVVAVATVSLPAAVALAMAVALCLVVPRLKDAQMVREGSARWQSFLELSSDYLEAMSGIPTLRSLGAAGRRRDALERRSDDVYTATMRPLRTSLVENGLTACCATLGPTLAVLVASGQASAGALEVTDVFLIMLLSIEAFRPIRDLSKAWHAGYLGLTAVDGLRLILDAPVAVPDRGTAAVPEIGARPALALREVAFRYADERALALVGLTLEVGRGEFVALVGHSGSGKSTILSLLARRLDPGAGTVRIAGADARGIRLDAVRDHVVYVGQHAHLFAGTIGENVRLGAPDASDAQVWNALDAARIAQVVAERGGLAAAVAQDGSTFSGGERQRIALARALVRDAPVLLLDEPTAHLDRRTEAEIMARLRGLTPERTVVVVSHRLESVAGCDRIAVVAGGRVVEAGAPGDLAAAGGAFAALLCDERERWPSDAGVGM